MRDLFFNIWLDEFGSGWIAFVILVSSIIFISLLVFFIRTKLKNKPFTKFHTILLIIGLFIMYQLVPIGIELSAMEAGSQRDNKVYVERIQKAINASIIPWQKGGYYCVLAEAYMMAKDHKSMFQAYEQAYQYVKSYKYPCWGLSFLTFQIKGDYDAAIEIAENVRIQGKPTPLYSFISSCYLLKGDLNNALVNINKDIENKETYVNLSQKAYILKVLGQSNEAISCYARALSLANNDKEKAIAKLNYNDFLGKEQKRIKEARHRMGIN